MACVSVVIPVYNIEEHLAECLDSVLNQTLQDIEVICVDDGSTDASPGILRQYADADRRVRVVMQANAGPGAARNNGMERAVGEYIIFLDSDDWFEPDFLEKMVDRIGETGADMVICRSVSFDTATGKELPSSWMLNTAELGDEFAAEDVAQRVFQITHGWPWDKLYRRSFVEREGFRFPDLRNSQDMVFVFPSILRAEKIALVERALIHHRFNRSSSVSNRRIEALTAPYEAVCMVRKYMESKKMLERYRDSFLNWTAGFLIWHISSIKDRKQQRALLCRFRTEWAPALGLREQPILRYRGAALKGKLLLAEYGPWWLFCGVSAGYNEAKQLVQKVRLMGGAVQ